MRTKLLILLAVAIIASTLFVGQILAAGEEGSGILYVYIDPEKTMLVEIDSNGRYYVVPGTEYYLTVSGITEYQAGEEFTVWAYRVNTTENIALGVFSVAYTPFDATFTWTIPDDWLDEVVKIKYGTNLETDYYFAKTEIWVNCRVGTGVLYVYEDPDRTGEAPLLDGKHYLVNPSSTYYFSISGITEYDDEEPIGVWARYGPSTNLRIADDVSIGVDDRVDFDWTIPGLPIGTCIKIKYGKEPTGSRDQWVYARRETEAAPRIMFVIPNVFLGSFGVISAMFSGAWVTSLLHKKKRN